MSAEAGFVTAASVEQAVAALGEPGTVAVAGGTSVGLLLGQRLLEPSGLVWLGRIPELREVARSGDRLVVGATVTLRELTAHPLVVAHLPALASAASAVGNIRVRAVATIGGALAHADPRQDLPPVLLAHDASVEVAGPTGRRSVPVAELADGFMSTCLADDELITAVTIPLVDGRRGTYHRYTPGSADDYPTVAVAATVTAPEGRGRTASLAVGGAGPIPYLVPEAEALAADGAAAVGRVARAAAERARPVDDRLGSAAYKRAMVAVWAERAMHDCLTALT